MIECLQYIPLYGLNDRLTFPHPDAILKHATTIGQNWPLIAILGDPLPYPLYYALYGLFLVKSNPGAFWASATKWPHTCKCRCMADPWALPAFQYDMRIYHLHQPREVICSCGLPASVMDAEADFGKPPSRPVWACKPCNIFVETKLERRHGEAPDLVPRGKLTGKTAVPVKSADDSFLDAFG